MLKLILPNENILEIEEGLHGYEVAKQISKSLEKKAIAYKIDDKIYDLGSVIEKEGKLTFLTEEDPESLDLLRHSAAHLLAEAVKRLYPDAKFGFGPTIEEGFYYDIDFSSPISDSDLAKIEGEMKKISKENKRIIRKEVSKEEALELFKDNPYKIELINEIKDIISVYSQGDFIDLCHGPHVPSTGFIKHFKLTSIAGAYWRGDSNNKMLVRIYGTAFFSDDDLKNHLNLIEERKKRDHRRLGKELGLFMMSDYGPGFPFWLPNGMTLRNTLEDFWYNIHRRNGYVFVKTPTMLSKELWEVSGHWYNYKENMYISEIDDKEYAIKPMNCPGGMLVYKNSMHSYKDLPLRIGELGLVHRHEASGALNGLFRVRTFTQDDAHIFLREDQIIDEIGRLLKLYDEVYSIFGLDFHIELSTRPENKYIGDIEIWNKAEKALEDALKAYGKKYKINPGDGAFYGPKLDFKLRDSIGRIWQCGTIQLDMNLPERFDLTYIDENNQKVRPIMLHRALFGSIERFIGIITEHFAGAFPTWLAPIQVDILPVNNLYHLEYARELVELFEDQGIRTKLDDREEKLGYRLREAQVTKIPYSLVIGDNEVANKTVTYRRYGEKDQHSVSLNEFLELIHDEIKNKKLLSK